MVSWVSSSSVIASGAAVPAQVPRSEPPKRERAAFRAKLTSATRPSRLGHPPHAVVVVGTFAETSKRCLCERAKQSVGTALVRGRRERKAVPGDHGMRVSLTVEPIRAGNSATSRQEARGRNSAPATKRCHGAEAAASLGVKSAPSAPTWSGARPPCRHARPGEVVGRPPRRGQRARAAVSAGAAAPAAGPAPLL